MAPLIPPRRRSSRPPRRSATDILAGLGAAALLFALIIGVPMALVAGLGSPVPHSMPALSMFTQRLDIASLLKILSLVVWLAWLQLIVCVAAEVRAAVRNTGMPSRVPLAGGIQPAVRRLVTAALVLFSAATALSPALAACQLPPAPPVVSAAPLPGPGGLAGGGALPAASPAASYDGSRTDGGSQAVGRTAATGSSLLRMRRIEKFYLVQPPEGRYHESLWEIAQDHLGDGRRYREIFELNSGHLQPDGSKLTIASLIRPGWILRMPKDAYGPGIKIVTLHGHAGGHSAHPDHDGRHNDHDARPSHSPDGSGATRQSPSPAQLGLGPAPQGPAQPSPAAPSPTQHRPTQHRPTQHRPSQHRPSQSGPVQPRPAMRGTSVHIPSLTGEPAYLCEIAVASLLAAGVLSALRRRRRRQMWYRQAGRRVATPGGMAAAAEAALRLGADEPSARVLDTSLRYLSQALAGQARALPTVFAAHVGNQHLDLWVAPADRDAPAPWVAVGDGQVWRLPFSAAPGLDPDEVAGAPAPYPGLVPIGTDATGQVLVDLEAAHGLIAVTGPPHRVRAALAAMAMGLATSLWSGPVQLGLVGFGADLAELAPDRVSVFSTLAEALPGLAARADMAEEALTAADAGGILTEGSALDPQSWVPHYLISVVPPSPAERGQLLALARTRHVAPGGYVIAGDIAGATWTWEVTEDGRLRAGLLGLDVRAQSLGPAERSAVADLFETAGQTEGVLLGAPSHDAAPAEHLVQGPAMPVEITMLGTPAVHTQGEIEPERVALATELVIYLATHPGGVHPNVLGAAVWPPGVTEEVRDAMLAHVRDWLGTDDIGRPHLAMDASGRLRLGSRVRVDWQVFCALVARAAEAAPGAHASAGSPAEQASLAQALSLVSGPFLAGREPGRYTWLASDGLEHEVEARVADAAHRNWQLLMADSDPYGAMAAARAGLRLAFGDEQLWRDLLTSAHATGQERVLRSAVDEVCARAALDEVLPQMAPETEALIDELLPSWRSSVA